MHSFTLQLIELWLIYLVDVFYMWRFELQWGKYIHSTDLVVNLSWMFNSSQTIFYCELRLNIFIVAIHKFINKSTFIISNNRHEFIIPINNILVSSLTGNKKNVNIAMGVSLLEKLNRHHGYMWNIATQMRSCSKMKTFRYFCSFITVGLYFIW